MLRSRQQQLTLSPPIPSSTDIFSNNNNNNDNNNGTKAADSSLSSAAASNNEFLERLMHQSNSKSPTFPSSSSVTCSTSKSGSNSPLHSGKEKSATARTLSTEFQSLKLESMSTGEEYGATCKTSTSQYKKESVQCLKNASGSLVCNNDANSVSPSSSLSGDEPEVTSALVEEQAKFFYQVKDFLLSQQMTLREQLEALNSRIARKPKVPQVVRRHHRHHYHSPRPPPPLSTLSMSRNLSHIPIPHSPHVSAHSSTSSKTDLGPDSNSDSNMPPENLQFFSCSSTEKSDSFQVCPICGVQLDLQDNSAAMEEHVAAHWYSP